MNVPQQPASHPSKDGVTRWDDTMDRKQAQILYCTMVYSSLAGGSAIPVLLSGSQRQHG